MLADLTVKSFLDNRPSMFALGRTASLAGFFGSFTFMAGFSRPTMAVEHG
jgi:hypothetical protein